MRENTAVEILGNIYSQTLLLILFVMSPLAGQCFAQQSESAALLDHLAGDWVLSGTLGGQHTTHYIHAEWVLNREYLRLHEVSAEKKPNGQPKYEAIIFIEWDTKRREYVCVWLDSTSGGGLSGPVAHAKPQPFSIPLVFTLSNTHTLHNTFTYNPKSDTWSSRISDVDNGKEDVFANVVLTRRLPHHTALARVRSKLACRRSSNCLPRIHAVALKRIQKRKRI